MDVAVATCVAVADRFGVTAVADPVVGVAAVADALGYFGFAPRQAISNSDAGRFFVRVDVEAAGAEAREDTDSIVGSGVGTGDSEGKAVIVGTAVGVARATTSVSANSEAPTDSS